MRHATVVLAVAAVVQSEPVRWVPALAAIERAVAASTRLSFAKTRSVRFEPRVAINCGRQRRAERGRLTVTS
jgi:hypothetical protein